MINRTIACLDQRLRSELSSTRIQGDKHEVSREAYIRRSAGPILTAVTATPQSQLPSQCLLSPRPFPFSPPWHSRPPMLPWALPSALVLSPTTAGFARPLPPWFSPRLPADLLALLPSGLAWVPPTVTWSSPSPITGTPITGASTLTLC